MGHRGSGRSGGAGLSTEARANGGGSEGGWFWALAAVIIMFANTRTGICTRGVRPGANLPMYGYQIVRAYPHDAKAFTQGLQFVDGALYEGTGQVGQSVDPEGRGSPPARCCRKRERGRRRIFGEGITVWKNDSDRADVANPCRLRLRPHNLPTEEAVLLSGRRLGADAGTPPV